MKIAITVWGNRISPVYDCAKTLMITQIENGKIVGQVSEGFNPKNSTQIASILNNLEINILICGAITESQSKTIERDGIKLISFVSGNAEKVLLSYIKEPLLIVDFLMPGTITEVTPSKNVFNF